MFYTSQLFFFLKSVFSCTLETTFIEIHFCADLGSILISDFSCVSCNIYIWKLRFSTVIPDVDHMHIIPGTLCHSCPSGVASLAQHPLKLFLSQNNRLWFQVAGALIHRPTLSLALTFEWVVWKLVLENITPNVEQIVPFVVHRCKNRCVTSDFFAMHWYHWISWPFVCSLISHTASFIMLCQYSLSMQHLPISSKMGLAGINPYCSVQ